MARMKRLDKAVELGVVVAVVALAVFMAADPVRSLFFDRHTWAGYAGIAIVLAVVALIALQARGIGRSLVSSTQQNEPGA